MKIIVAELSKGTLFEQEFAQALVILAEPLPDAERNVAIRPLLERLPGLLTSGGQIDLVAGVASGLGRCGNAAEIFRVASAAGQDISRWALALQSAASYLDRSSTGDALDLALAPGPGIDVPEAAA